MFRFVSFCLVLAVCMSCGNAGKDSATETPDSARGTVAIANAKGIGRIEFEQTEFDFGQVKEGEIVERLFSFTNTGTAPVILEQVSASCGCTTPAYTQTPVQPGKTGEIKVRFDSNGQVGRQQKIISVASNAENGMMTVQIRGEVKAK